MYYDAMRHQNAKVSPLPSPANINNAPSLGGVEVSEVDEEGEQEVSFNLNHTSEDALMLAGRIFVEEGVDFQVPFGSSATALKVSAHDTNPRHYREAMSSDNHAEWYKAMCEEMNSIYANGTWRVVYLPAGKKAVGSQWVYKVKHLPSGAIERFKACIVAQGFSQRPGVDFDETFAPTARWNAVCAILAIVAIDDMHLESVDISSAFLNGIVDAELYIKLPEGFPQQPDKDLACLPGDGPPVGCLLKGLYSLKQGAFLWHKRMHEVFTLLGFTRIISDPCVYVYLRDNVQIIIPVHVDDMTIASTSRPSILKLIDQLREHFDLRHLGPTVGLLGVCVDRDRPNHKLWIHQRPYATDILSCFSMLDSKPVTTPMDPNVKLSKSQSPQTDAEKEEMKNYPYLQATGALLYLALCTRPDIAFTVGVLCCFNSNPGLEHWKAVKHLLRYVRGTLDYKIEYSAAASTPSTNFFTMFSNADHGGNLDNGRSTTGTLLMMAGGAVSWSSRIQTIVAQSTTEAEFVAASESGHELCWLRNFLADIGIPQIGPSNLNMDNQSAISVSKHPEHMGRLKHLDRHWFWLREAVSDKKIAPVYIPTTDMTADLLTKSLTRELVEKFHRKMGIVGEWSQENLR